MLVFLVLPVPRAAVRHLTTVGGEFVALLLWMWPLRQWLITDEILPVTVEHLLTRCSNETVAKSHTTESPQWVERRHWVRRARSHLG
jgi:hypothetical protein